MVSADAEEKKGESAVMEENKGKEVESGRDADIEMKDAHQNGQGDGNQEEEVDEKAEKEEALQEEEQNDEGKFGEESEQGKAEKKDDKEEDDDEEKLSKKRRIGDNGEEHEDKEEDSDKKELVTPNERPTRERKTVERYSVPSVVRSMTPKSLSIEKGSGVKLSEIPNVAYKLSKKKPDDNLQLLHTILFGKKAKAHMLKRNLGQFSGFVWTDNEEKQKAKVKEKIDKCVKEKLVEYCYLFDIQVNKAAAKKEELSVKLVEFLQSPHATTDALLASAEQKSKLKQKVTSTKADTSSGRPAKKRKKSSDASNKKTKASKEEEEKEQESEEDSEPANEEEHKVEKSEEKTDSDKSEEDEPELRSDRKGSSKRKSNKESAGRDKTTVPKETPPAKLTKKASGSARKGATNGSAASGSQSKSKGSSSKKHSVETKKEKNIKDKGKSKSKTETSNSPIKVPAKGQGKGRAKKSKEPTREEMHAVVVNILKEVDFNTATLSDILRQLGSHFGVDLLHRKAEVKEIITEVISNMTDDEEDEDEEKSDTEEKNEEEEENKEHKQRDEEEDSSDQEDEKDNKDQIDDKDNKNQENDDAGTD